MLGQMSKVRGVTLVSLSDSSRLSKSSAGGGGNSDCRNGNDKRSLFQMVLFMENATPVLPPDSGVTATPAAASTTATSTTPSTSSSASGSTK
jgi:hypothetical protein